MTDEELKKLVESNAKAIQALTNELTRSQRIAEKDRSRMYEAIARMAAAQSHFWQIQEDYYQRLEEIDRRQSRTVELLDKISQRLGE